MRAIKKIAALVTGATMLGATVMGAMAADLSNYPAPFVSGCSFSGAIVVGEKAASSDVAGAIDVASTLAVSGTTTSTSGITRGTFTDTKQTGVTNTNQFVNPYYRSISSPSGTASTVTTYYLNMLA